ncbi:hypothetical protein CVT24_002944 [Panaeolus cyanescens]|uniref:HSF-type DNA-binding domain-containing protein n=1 Tax=Panaeolus cyanescens TaxID=181874 RepID=A0A409VP88_9AGAR|nr:hypothetical protein CVT24_002944 [Panaeolus cyanescens]
MMGQGGKMDTLSNSTTAAGTGATMQRTSEDPMPSTSDFVKKLYKMLEDPSFQSVVCWGPAGDCFVVKDMNEFTKSILPRMFKHSNFASFVRQLNKYDFHKVKNTDDNQFGEHSWTFRHPDFHAHRRDALENIKRKVPAARKSQQAAAAAAAAAQQTYPSRSGSPPHHTHPHHSSSSLPYPPPQLGSLSSSSLSPLSSLASLQLPPGIQPHTPAHTTLLSQEIVRSKEEILRLRDEVIRTTTELARVKEEVMRASGELVRANNEIVRARDEVGRVRDEGEEMRGRIRSLERNYESVLVEMVGFQRGMAQQDGLMQSLIGYFLGSEGGE